MTPRIAAILRKEMIQLRRDPRSLFLALGLPIVLLLIFGYAVKIDIRHVTLAVVDQDNTSLSRDLRARLQSTEYFDLRYVLPTSAGTEELLDEGKVKIIVVVPSHFSRDLANGRNVGLQLLIDGSNNNTALIAMGYITRLIQDFSTRIIRETVNARGGSFSSGFPFVDPQIRVWYNPELRSTNFIVPGLIAVVMMIVTTMLTSLTVAREWETGTMEQLISTPARPFEIVIGKLIPYFLLGVVQISIVVLVGTFVFKVPLKGSLLFLFIVSAVFLLNGLGIGLLISTVTKSQQLAFMLCILFTMLPSFILSGFIFPISSMPWVIQYFTAIIPAKYFLIILRGIFLKGTGIGILWPEFLILTLFALAFLLICSRRLKLSLE
jgi:ABC-2 type transport system permease protein